MKTGLLLVVIWSLLDVGCSFTDQDLFQIKSQIKVRPLYRVCVWIVCHHMFGQGTFLGKGFLAHITLIWFLTTMYQHMLGQGTQMGE